MADRRAVGRVGEEAACKYLTDKSYKILSRNFRFGRYGEIDIVAQKAGVICFIEVKARTSDRFGAPSESVGYAKRRKILTVANYYLRLNDAFGQRVRFDIIEIYYITVTSELSAKSNSSDIKNSSVANTNYLVTKLRHITNAFGDNWA